METKTSDGYYKVKVFCRNCGEGAGRMGRTALGFKIEILRGRAVKNESCPYCGCETLVRI